MKRRAFRRGFICVVGDIVAGSWPGRRLIIAAMAVVVLLPVDASDAGWLSDVFKSPPKHTKSPKHVTSSKRATSAKHADSPKHRAARLAALGPVALPPSVLKSGRNKVRSLEIPDRSDVGHTANRKARPAPATSPNSPSICALREASRRD